MDYDNRREQHGICSSTSQDIRTDELSSGRGSSGHQPEDRIRCKKSVYHPLTMKNVDLDKSDTFVWTNKFLEELKRRRNFALRLGKLTDWTYYNLRPEVTKKLMQGKLSLSDLNEDDFMFVSTQKGVDMRIGLDIASLAYKKQVDQIILIAGDSDFVPAAKLARREGIDFILDPMWATIKEDLFEHIDGLKSSSFKKKHINHASET